MARVASFGGAVFMVSRALNRCRDSHRTGRNGVSPRSLFQATKFVLICCRNPRELAHRRRLRTPLGQRISLIHLTNRCVPATHGPGLLGLSAVSRPQKTDEGCLEEDAPSAEAGKMLEFAQWVTGVGLPGREGPRCLVPPEQEART